MRYTNLVIGGAGSKNYAAIGALKVLNNKLQNVKRILGVSSGSILATLLAVGCTSDEIKKYYEMVDVSQFKVKYNSLYTYYKMYRYSGINDSKKFREDVIHKILEEKTGNGCITFKEIFDTYGITLVIPAACVNKREMFYYHHHSNPEMQVKYAIEQSSCVPGIFYPIQYKGNTMVDAGIIDNYPLYYFDVEDHIPNSRLVKVSPTNVGQNSNTLGILIIDSNTSKVLDDPYLGDDNTSTTVSYMKAVLNTLLTTNSRARIGHGYWENTIAIDIGVNMDGVSDMELDDETKKLLYLKGSTEAEKFISLYS